MSNYNKTHYLLSVHNLKQLPEDSGREVAFAGRSNAGKSSVINTLTARKSLARISKTPGRTQQINFFTVEHGVRLVDLPGYGYARVSAKLRAHWGKTINHYFETRASLCGLILIVDIRRALQEYDRQMLDWCVEAGLRAHVLLNKSDKLSFGAARRELDKARRSLPADTVTIQLFSALKKTGKEEAISVLDNYLYGN